MCARLRSGLCVWCGAEEEGPSRGQRGRKVAQNRADQTQHDMSREAVKVQRRHHAHHAHSLIVPPRLVSFPRAPCCVADRARLLPAGGGNAVHAVQRIAVAFPYPDPERRSRNESNGPAACGGADDSEVRQAEVAAACGSRAEEERRDEKPTHDSDTIHSLSCVVHRMHTPMCRRMSG